MDGTPRTCGFHPVSFPPCTIHSTNRRMTLLLGLVVAPITSYILTYWPLCRILHRPFGVHELMAMHRFIWYISTTNVRNPFMSSAWYTWPLNTSPQRALSYLVGNPVVTWGGLAALIFCLGAFGKLPPCPRDCFFFFSRQTFFNGPRLPKRAFFVLLLPICDDPGSGHRGGRGHYPAHHLRRPRQRDRAACRGCRFLVVLSPDGTLGNALGLRSRMLVVRRQEQ